jgi:hypothetical protein
LKRFQKKKLSILKHLPTEHALVDIAAVAEIAHASGGTLSTTPPL